MNFNRNLVNKNKLFQHSNLPTEENTLELIKNKNNLPVNEKVIDKEDYSNKDYLIKYLYKENPAFFEKFDLYDYLNSGSIGYVYKGAYKGPVKKQVAIKFIINKKRKEKENSNLEEINISKKLHNKNVTEIFAFYKNDKICYSVLEHIKHGDLEHFLKDLLKRSVLSETALNYFAKQILDGLQYIHRCKIAHMDIKPGNILIDSNLNCKITDFSVSCSYSSFHPEDLVKFPFVGTGKFIAPEILSRTNIKIKETEKFDIYSFGVTLYYLFYGEYPYKLKEVKGKDYEGIKNKINENNLEFSERRKISTLFKDFLAKALEKDYTKRMTIKEALNHPWIQSSKIIFDEKEKTCNQENFLIQLITDNIREFNEYLRI